MDIINTHEIQQTAKLYIDSNNSRTRAHDNCTPRTYFVAISKLKNSCHK